MIKKFTLDDLENKINYAVANNVTTHFTVLGDICADIVDYIEYEHNLKQWTEDDEPFYDFEPNIVYTLTIYDGEYYVQESYYQREDGEILLSYGDENEIAYIEVDTELTTSDIQRILCDKIVLFKLDTEESLCEEEDYEQLCPNTPCEKCGECFDTYKDNFTSVEYSNINGNKTYKVNGEKVTKEEYDKASEEISFDDTFSRFERYFNNKRNIFRLM